VEGAVLGNFFRVSDELYRSKQPAASDIPELQRVGIKTVLSLREYHHDSKEFARAQIAVRQCAMDAGDVSVAGLVEALRLIHNAPKPVLVHCWHGSDRTGFVVAGYRMVMMNWTADQAVDELRRGGFGYHEFFYPNVIRVLRAMNVAEVRKAVLAEEAAPAVPATPASGKDGAGR
jgi:protein tyrosine/serine phosphatase